MVIGVKCVNNIFPPSTPKEIKPIEKAPLHNIVTEQKRKVDESMNLSEQNLREQVDIDTN